MPVVNGWAATFRFESPAADSDELLLGRLVDVATGNGFTASRFGRGNSGIEACVTLSRDRVLIAVYCVLHESDSELLLWHAPPWFWQRILKPSTEPGLVEAALAAARDVANQVLEATPSASDVRWKTTKEHAAEPIRRGAGECACLKPMGRRTMRWNGRGEVVCPLRGQSLESRLAAQRSVRHT
jgi:hypothetical protein